MHRKYLTSGNSVPNQYSLQTKYAFDLMNSSYDNPHMLVLTLLLHDNLLIAS